MPRLKQKKSFVLKVSLAMVEPSIWRRIVVPSSLSLKKLHEVLQIVMGWGNYHLHQFVTHEGAFGTPDPDFPDDTIDESRVRLDRLITRPKDHLRYDYDFGDGWEHTILLERVIEAAADDRRVWCIDGERACPPEDVGGPYGYLDFLVAWHDDEHEEHDTCVRWIGDEFDPEKFDVQTVNRALTPRRRRG